MTVIYAFSKSATNHTQTQSRNEPNCLWAQSDVHMLRCMIIIMYNDCSLCSCNMCSRWFREPQTPGSEFSSNIFTLLESDKVEVPPRQRAKRFCWYFLDRERHKGAPFWQGVRLNILCHNSAEEGVQLFGLIRKWPHIHFDCDRGIMQDLRAETWKTASLTLPSTA